MPTDIGISVGAEMENKLPFVVGKEGRDSQGTYRKTNQVSQSAES